MKIRLVRLSEEYKEQLAEMMDEWSNAGEKIVPFAIRKNDYHDFDYYLEHLEITSEIDGKVPDTTLFCLDEDRNIFVGAVNIRHYLTPKMLVNAGHIGDGIRPSERRKGYGTAMIGLALEEAKKLGINNVLMCCAKDNIASAKSIIKNGGVLENEVVVNGVIEQRYWIRNTCKNTYKNIVFDLYGTLVNIHTDESKPEFWEKMAVYYGERGAVYEPRELAHRYGERIAEQVAALPVGGEVDLGQVFADLYMQKNPEMFCDANRQSAYKTWTSLPDKARQLIIDTAAAFRSFSMEKLRLFDGVVETLDGLKTAGKKIYLLSNAQALFTGAELRMTGLEGYFDGILLSSDAGYKKPSGEFYGLLTERFGVLPQESLMVGNDDVADCHGAAAAGMDSLYIYTEQSPRRERPLPQNCREIADIREVLSYI